MLPYLEDIHPMSDWLVHRNLVRQYDFMNSSFMLWQTHGRPFITNTFICDLNFYAAHHLSAFPGQLRGDRNDANVYISGSVHQPPDHSEVGRLMDDFILKAQRLDASADPVYTASYILWRLNWIHPFVQGNGRTARAACYFYLCQKFDLWLPGTSPMHELIRRDRDEYCRLLIAADNSIGEDGIPDLLPIKAFLERLLTEQLASMPVEQVEVA